MTERQVKRIFREEQAKFAVLFPSAIRVKLVVRERHYMKGAEERDVAWFEIGGARICLIKAALRLSAGTLRGILRHELGHAVDPRVNESGSERRADRLAAKAAGPVRYLTNGLQHATHGRVGRPKWLHQ